MARRITFAQFSRILEQAIVRIKPETALVLEKAGPVMVTAAKNKIGKYQPAVGFSMFPEWAPLTAGTISEKRRLGYAPPDNPLLRSGNMRASVEFYVFANALHVGSTDPVAKWQELGTRFIPPRPFIGPAMYETWPAVKAGMYKIVPKAMGLRR